MRVCEGLRLGNDALLVNTSRADAATEVGKEVTFGSVKGLGEGKVVLRLREVRGWGGGARCTCKKVGEGTCPLKELFASF